MTTEPYRPSNGTEGEMFYERWCANCERERGKKCRILTLTFALDIDDPHYPKQWVCDTDVPYLESNPRCTAFTERRAHDPAPLTIIRDKRQQVLL